MSRPVEDDLAAGRVEQAHDAARHRRLAAAGLADDAERLALRARVKLTPSTACTAATCFWKMIPRVTGKCFLRSSTTSSSSPVASTVRLRATVMRLARLRHRPREQLRRLAVLRLLVEVARAGGASASPGDRLERAAPR